MSLKRAKTAPATSIPCFSKVHLCYFAYRKGLHQHLFLIIKKKKFFFGRGFLVSYKKVQCTFYRGTHRASQAERMAPLSSFPEATPHISGQVTYLCFTVSTVKHLCASLVHIHFMYRLAECVLGSLLLCFMLLGLWKAS